MSAVADFSVLSFNAICRSYLPNNESEPIHSDCECIL